MSKRYLIFVSIKNLSIPSFLVYVHIGNGEDQTNEFAATVDVRFGIFPGNRRFSILVSQFNCDDENIPPDGCLQYFRGKTGT